MEKPFFSDVTLRDGNQSLKRPWGIEEKEIIFKQLLKLGVQGIEVGFPCSSELDFKACKNLAEIAPENVTISAFTRAIKNDIHKTVQAIQNAPKPCLFTYVPISDAMLDLVLKKTFEEIKKNAIEAVSYAKSIMPKNGEIKFGIEHFGDCQNNLDKIVSLTKDVAQAGANTITLANTVERHRPATFVEMVKKVRLALPDNVAISVHCHNDLGMATATTVESYFAGSVQLECTLNGIGERSGNANLYEVALALHNSGVEVPLNLDKIYETALLVSKLSGIPIYEKAPIIGKNVFTNDNNYDNIIPFTPEIIGKITEQAEMIR